MKKKDDIQLAREFFENLVKILGENELYRMLYGELPIDNESEDRARFSMEAYQETKPLREMLEKLVIGKPIKEDAG